MFVPTKFRVFITFSLALKMTSKQLSCIFAKQHYDAFSAFST